MPLTNEKGGPSVSRPIPNFVLADNSESKLSLLQLQALRLCRHCGVTTALAEILAPMIFGVLLMTEVYGQTSRRDFVLGALRCTCLRLKLIENEIFTFGTALRGGFITPTPLSNGLPTPANDAGKPLASDDKEVRHDR